MNTTTTPNARSLAIALVAALSLGQFGTVQAQEGLVKGLATILGIHLAGTQITCTPGTPTSDISACVRLPTNVGNSQVLLDHYADSTRSMGWSTPWLEQPGSPSRGRQTVMTLNDGSTVSMCLWLHPAADAHQQTVLWVTQIACPQAVTPEGD